MAAILAAAPPSDAAASRLSPALAKSPLHVQLLLMMGACHHEPTVMAEAEKVQRLLQAIMPEDEKEAADAAKQWTEEKVSKLSTSNDAADLLLAALLLDPASPHAHLRNPSKSISLYGLAAIKLPSTYACARLAHFYITGDRNVVSEGKDIAKGAKWLRMGASKGHALCQYQLGFLLEEGMIDGKPDAKQACEWYRKAADLKYPPAMYNLATLLLEPDETYEGVEQDVYTGIRLMEDAAALGDSSAQLKLGHLCFLGNADLEIEASIPRCIQYLSMAAHNESDPSPDAASILGIIFSTPNSDSYTNEHYDLERGVRYLKLAVQGGHEKSRQLLQAQLEKLDIERERKAREEPTQVVDPNSKHLEALRMLSLQEGVPIEMPKEAEAADASSASAAASSLPLPTTTPSPESLLLALTRLHSRFPEMGAARLHATLKSEYPHWEISEKRVKRVVKEQGWTAEVRPPVVKATPLQETAAASSSSASSSAPIPAIVLESTITKQRLNEKAIVNDLD